MTPEQETNLPSVMKALNDEGWLDIRSEGEKAIFFYGKRSGNKEYFIATMNQDGRWGQLVVR